MLSDSITMGTISKKVHDVYGQDFLINLERLTAELKKHTNNMNIVVAFTMVKKATENESFSVQNSYIPALNAKEKILIQQLVKQHVNTIKCELLHLWQYEPRWSVGRWRQKDNTIVYDNQRYNFSTGTIARYKMTLYQHIAHIFNLDCELRMVYDEIGILDVEKIEIGLAESFRPYAELASEVEKTCEVEAKDAPKPHNPEYDEELYGNDPYARLDALHVIDIIQEVWAEKCKNKYLTHDPKSHKISVNSSKLEEVRAKGWHCGFKDKEPICFMPEFFNKKPDAEFYDKNRNEMLFVYMY